MPERASTGATGSCCGALRDLHVDWRWGERDFAQNLNDFDLASNNGGWQWAASTGCDAQPYFRIFNPVTQSQKFDPQGTFIRLYLPELARVPTGTSTPGGQGLGTRG